MQNFKIISGGQVGVDRFALDWAIKHNVPHGGWCPKGRRSEDGVIPTCYDLQETTSQSYKTRTRQNVSSSDGTLILTPSRELTGGSLLTRNYCIKHGRPYLHLCPGDRWRNQIDSFIQNNWIEVLNVAGPRDAADIEQFVYDVLDKVASAFAGAVPLSDHA